MVILKYPHHLKGYKVKDDEKWWKVGEEKRRNGKEGVVC